MIVWIVVIVYALVTFGHSLWLPTRFFHEGEKMPVPVWLRVVAGLLWPVWLLQWFMINPEDRR